MTFINYFENLKLFNNDNKEKDLLNSNFIESKRYISNISNLFLSIVIFLTFFYKMILQQGDKDVLLSFLYLILKL